MSPRPGTVAAAEDRKGGLKVWLQRRAVLRLVSFTVAYRWQALGTALTMIAITGTGLVGPYLLRLAIDQGIANKDFAYLGMIAGLYLAAGVLGAFLSGVQTYGVNWVGERVIRDLRDSLFRHLTSLDIDYYTEQRAGWIVSRLTNDIEALESLLVEGVTQLVVNTLTLLGATIILFSMDARLALATMTVMPFLLVGTVVFRARASAAYGRVRTVVAEVTAYLQESLSGIREVQAYDRADHDTVAFAGVNEKNRKANMDTVYISGSYFPGVEFLSAVATAIILLYGGSKVAAGELTVGVLVAFIGYLSSFFDPVQSLSELYNTFQSSGAALQKIVTVLETEPGDAEVVGELSAGRLAGRLECRDISFSYGSEGDEVLDRVSLSIPAGQRVALVGPTGAGKTTLAKLLLRFHHPTSGTIEVDGVDLRDYNIREYRKNVGYVAQEPYLFSGSILDNIRLTDPQATAESVIESTRALGVHELFASLPEGYDTDVQERGSRLSSGERQLVSFARAFFSQPRILILDEATSSVDPGTERLIEAALARLLADRTSLIIAHRLSTVESSDRILVMEDGRIVEDGTHSELLTAGGPYARLYRAQLLHTRSTP